MASLNLNTTLSGLAGRHYVREASNWLTPHTASSLPIVVYFLSVTTIIFGNGFAHKSCGMEMSRMLPTFSWVNPGNL
jgi:hypothetical protein